MDDTRTPDAVPIATHPNPTVAAEPAAEPPPVSAEQAVSASRPETIAATGGIDKGEGAGEGRGGDAGAGHGGPVSGSIDELKWLEIEYQKAADRYDNIYKSYWSTFSYTAAIAAAMLTFGGNNLAFHFTLVLACIPVLFWYWASSIPLDKYADETAQRLKRIEEIVRQLISRKRALQGGVQEPDYGPWLFTKFESRKEVYSGFPGAPAVPPPAVLGTARQPSDKPRVLESAYRRTGDFLAERPSKYIRDHPFRVRAVVNALFAVIHVAFVFAVVFWIMDGPRIAKQKEAPANPSITIDVGPNLGGVLRDALKKP